MNQSKVSKVEILARIRKRIGYCERYHLPIATDVVLERLYKVLKEVK